jgi:hypothetical protein
MYYATCIASFTQGERELSTILLGGKGVKTNKKLGAHPRSALDFYNSNSIN